MAWLFFFIVPQHLMQINKMNAEIQNENEENITKKSEE